VARRVEHPDYVGHGVGRRRCHQVAGGGIPCLIPPGQDVIAGVQRDRLRDKPRGSRKSPIICNPGVSGICRTGIVARVRNRLPHIGQPRDPAANIRKRARTCSWDNPGAERPVLRRRKHVAAKNVQALATTCRTARGVPTLPVVQTPGMQQKIGAPLRALVRLRHKICSQRQNSRVISFVRGILHVEVIDEALKLSDVVAHKGICKVVDDLLVRRAAGFRRHRVANRLGVHPSHTANIVRPRCRRIERPNPGRYRIERNAEPLLDGSARHIGECFRVLEGSIVANLGRAELAPEDRVDGQGHRLTGDRHEVRACSDGRSVLRLRRHKLNRLPRLEHRDDAAA